MLRPHFGVLDGTDVKALQVSGTRPAACQRRGISQRCWAKIIHDPCDCTTQARTALVDCHGCSKPYAHALAIDFLNSGKYCLESGFINGIVVGCGACCLLACESMDALRRAGAPHSREFHGFWE